MLNGNSNLRSLNYFSTYDYVFNFLLKNLNIRRTTKKWSDECYRITIPLRRGLCLFGQPPASKWLAKKAQPRQTPEAWRTISQAFLNNGSQCEIHF